MTPAEHDEMLRAHGYHDTLCVVSQQLWWRIEPTVGVPSTPIPVLINILRLAGERCQPNRASNPSAIFIFHQ